MMRGGGLLVAAVTVCAACSSAGGGQLELATRKSRILDDGELSEITIKATELSGRVGSGVVRLTASAGGFSESPVQLDAYGTGKTGYSCDQRTTEGCTGTITVRAEWNGASSELTIRLAERCPGAKLCGEECATLPTSWHHCGACGRRCQPMEQCTNGACVPCTGDCDRDGWQESDGDCCDRYDQCSKPELVNPGAIENAGNNLDDNCNGLLDGADTLDVSSCDEALGPRVTDPMDWARTLGLCRATTESSRSWGVISAELLLADGKPGVPPNSASIRPVFGTIAPQEGSRLAVFATDVASDKVQTNPGLSDSTMQTTADISACDAGSCIRDWLMSARPGVKQAGKLPASAGCNEATEQKLANDSVMLKLRIRAPTNAKSFRLRSRFFSLEYPEFVCSQFNDQMVLLIDTPGATVGNPVDKNLMTYSAGADAGVWPVGINLAAGTPLFQVCQSRLEAPTCWDESVSSLSCAQGPGELAQTQFAASMSGGCVEGGGTVWMGTRGNVKPGQVFELRAAVWDVGDHILDSLILLDDFEWFVEEVEPGTGE